MESSSLRPEREKRRRSAACSWALKNVFAAIDSAWDPVEEHAKNLKHKGFFSKWAEGALRSILDKQLEEIREPKSAKTHKPLPALLVIIDHFADTGITHNATNILTR